MKTRKTNKVTRISLEKPAKNESAWYSQEIINDTFRDLDDLTDRLFGSRQEAINKLAGIQRMAM